MMTPEAKDYLISIQRFLPDSDTTYELIAFGNEIRLIPTDRKTLSHFICDGESILAAMAAQTDEAVRNRTLMLAREKNSPVLQLVERRRTPRVMCA